MKRSCILGCQTKEQYLEETKKDNRKRIESLRGFLSDKLVDELLKKFD